MIKLLPKDYETACFQTGEIKRKRNIQAPKELMQLCITYLFNDFSLVEMSVAASQTGSASLSDVAFMKHFAAGWDWFEWMIQELSRKPVTGYKKSGELEGYPILAIDGSVTMEKGAAPKEWLLHYALDLFSLNFHQTTISAPSTGETLKNYQVNKKDLFVGARAYGTKNSIFDSPSAPAQCWGKKRGSPNEIGHSRGKEPTIPSRKGAKFERHCD